ncbi:MAG: YraN family protein, partial [Nitrospinae bacterium CG11_big_fil_rev_8_21_14_0_20_56_8]
MTRKNLDLGQEGERKAADFLRSKGYRILQRNFRCAAGEIDIIAEDRKTVVFVEVKTRSGEGVGHPSLAVTPAKQKKIAQ